MKILYITTVGGTMPFFKSLIRELLDKGIRIDIASNNNTSAVPDYYQEWGCQIFTLSCTRSPVDRGNLIAIKEIKKLVQNNHYDIIHCHTPIAAACTRIACREIRKNGSKVFYTAHGFHFYKGAPFKNWLLYYSVEWLCAHWTDVLITINKEDFSLAQKRLKIKCIKYVPGIGIDIKKFSETKIDREQKRKELGVPEEAIVLLSVGELNANKNHGLVIKALAQIGNKNIHYVVAGQGGLEDYLCDLVLELRVQEQVHFLGFRNDIEEIYRIADLYIHPSLREGLPVAVMEAVASQIPVICSDIRGCKDLVDKECLFCPLDLIDIVGKITRFTVLGSMSQYVEKNYKNLQKYNMENVIKKMCKLYFYN